MYVFFTAMVWINPPGHPSFICTIETVSDDSKSGIYTPCPVRNSENPPPPPPPLNLFLVFYFRLPALPVGVRETSGVISTA